MVFGWFDGNKTAEVERAAQEMRAAEEKRRKEEIDARQKAIEEEARSKNQLTIERMSHQHLTEIEKEMDRLRDKHQQGEREKEAAHRRIQMKIENSRQKRREMNQKKVEELKAKIEMAETKLVTQKARHLEVQEEMTKQKKAGAIERSAHEKRKSEEELELSKAHESKMNELKTEKREMEEKFQKKLTKKTEKFTQNQLEANRAEETFRKVQMNNLQELMVVSGTDENHWEFQQEGEKVVKFSGKMKNEFSDVEDKLMTTAKEMEKGTELTDVPNLEELKTEIGQLADLLDNFTADKAAENREKYTEKRETMCKKTSELRRILNQMTSKISRYQKTFGVLANKEDGFVDASTKTSDFSISEDLEKITKLMEDICNMAREFHVPSIDLFQQTLVQQSQKILTSSENQKTSEKMVEDAPKKDEEDEEEDTEDEEQ